MHYDLPCKLPPEHVDALLDVVHVQLVFGRLEEELTFFAETEVVDVSFGVNIVELGLLTIVRKDLEKKAVAH